MVSLTSFRILQTVAIAALVIGLVALMRPPVVQPVFHQVYFGDQVQLVSVTPGAQSCRPGETLQFDVQWSLAAPLPADHVIAYYVGRPGEAPAAFVDTRAPLRGGTAYAELAARGGFVDDTVQVPLPPATPPGVYEVSTFVYPTAGYEIDPALRSRVSAGQRCLFSFEVKP